MNLASLIIDKNSAVPLHQQVYRAMKTAIRSGQLVSGELCPTEAEWTKVHDLSRPVVQQAYNQLMEEKLIHRHKGKGTFVAQKEMDYNLIQSLLPMTAIIEQNGWDPSVKQLDAHIQTYDQDRMGDLDLLEGEAVLTLKRLYYADGAPFCFFNIYLPIRRFLDIQSLDLKSGSLYTTLSTHYPFKIAKAARAITAVILEDEVCKALKVHKGSAGFRIENVNYDAYGHPLDSSVHYMKGLGMNVSFDFYKNAVDHKKTR